MNAVDLVSVLTAKPQAAFLVLALATAAAAEDVVYLKSAQPGRRPTKVVGTVVDFTGQELRIRSMTGGESKIRARRVLRVETKQTPAHVEGNKLAAQGKLTEALAQYRIALAEEQNRIWVQREILAQIVSCRHALGRIEQAGEAFLKIVQNDPTTQHFDRIPLAWRPHEPSLTLERKARAWLSDRKSATGRLMGASWLLSSRDRADALAALNELTDDDDPRIVLLAVAQLWRTKIVAATPKDADLWRLTTAGLPEPLRAGPYFVVGRALARQQRHEQAATAFLRVPVLYGQHRSLAASALFAAGEQLEKIDQKEQAAGLYRELLRKYPEAPETAAAKARLQTK